MVGIPLGEVLQIKSLREIRLLAGRQGIHRVVTDVSVLEVARDFWHFLRGGELVLTTLYAMQGDHHAQVEAIRRMADLGVAALGLHPFITGTHVHEDLIAAADTHGLPLIQLPASMAYAEVITAVLGNILNRQSIILRKSEDINREFTRLILQGGGVHAIAAGVCRLINQPVLITDETLESLATGTQSMAQRAFLETCLQSPDFRETLAVLHSKRVATQLIRTGEFVTFKVKAGGRVLNLVVAQATARKEVHGYIFTWETGGIMQELDFIALAHASTALALEMTKERAVQETENRLKSDFLAEVLAGRFTGEEDLLRRGRLMGVDLARKHMVLLVRLELGLNDKASASPQDQRAVARAEHRMQTVLQRVIDTACPRSLVLPRGDTILIMMHFERPSERDPARERGRDLARVVQAALAPEFEGVPISVGVGDFYVSPLDLNKSYRDAVQALDIGVRIYGHGVVAGVQDLGVFGVLGGTPRGSLGEYVTRVLQQLLEYDAKNNTELAKTLEIYLDEKDSLIAASKRLFVHPNTVRYRIEKIREMLGPELFANPEQRLNFHLALKCRRLLT